MLGINSHISNSGEESAISNCQHKSSVPTKITHLTEHLSVNQESTGSQEKHTIHRSAKQQKKFKELKKKLQQMEKLQEIAEKRFETYVQNLERELQKKKKQNEELQICVNSLKDDINESKTDVQVLSNYITKRKVYGVQNNKIKANQPIKDRGSFHSNKKLSPTSIRQTSGLKKSTNIGYWKLKSTN